MSERINRPGLKSIASLFSRKNIPILILSSFGLLISFIGIFNHYYFKTVTYDYANYNFAFWDYAHFRISQLPTFQGTFLQDHFYFTLMYFVPLYWLFNWITGTYTLILIQNALILIAAWYSHKLIKLQTSNLWLSSGVLFYFFLLFGRYSAFGTDVNLAIMSACFVPVFIYYFQVKKYLGSFVLLVLSLFSRENMPLWFVFIYLVLIVINWKDKKAVIISILGISISILYFVLLFKVFIPAIETLGIEYKLFEYSALGATPGEAFRFMLLHPFETIKLFFVNHLNDANYDNVKLDFYLTYLISGGFVLLTRPKYIIWFIPVVAQKVLNDSPFRWGLATYYSVEIVTLLPISVFLALSSFRLQRLQNIFIILVCLGSLGATIHKMDSSNHVVPWTFYKHKIKFYGNDFYEAPFPVKKVRQVMELIPENAKVSSSNLITPHIAQREWIYFFPTVKDAEYIIFSLFDDNYLMSSEENERYRNKYLASPNWEIIAREYPVFLLKKKKSSSTGKKPVLVFNTAIDTLNCNFEHFDTNNNHILFSNLTKADTLSHLNDKHSKSSKHSICLNPESPFSHGIHLGTLKNLYQLEISAWCYGETKNAHIILDNKVNLYRNSSIVEGSTEGGWKKIRLLHRFEENQNLPSTIVYLWNAGSIPVYFDDLQIVIKRK